MFFSAGSCRDLTFVPTPQSAIALEKAGLLTRNTLNGIRVFYDDDSSDSLRLYAADPDRPLTLGFKVFSQDPCFQNYTEPSPHKEDSILYFDNRRAAIDPTGRLRLHEGETVSETDFTPLHSPLLAEMLSNTDRLVRPLCVVNVCIAAGERRFFSDQLTIIPQSYYLKFKARSTFWKYYLLGHLAREDVAITDLDNETAFVFTGEESLADNRVAFAFRSTTPIPLREKSTCRFQLKEGNSGGGKVLIMRLPVASTSQITREVIDGEDAIVSEMFVNC